MCPESKTGVPVAPGMVVHLSQIRDCNGFHQEKKRTMKVSTWKPEKVAVLSKWSFISWQITVKWQFTKCKLAVYSKVVVYSKAAVYKCKVVVYSKVAVYKCKAAVYKCKVAVYTCKPAVYSCKVLNFRFTTVILITLLDTVEVTPFFQFFV